MQILLLILLAMIPLTLSVEIVGLFPKCTYDSSYEQTSASSFKPSYCAAIDVWSRHCVAMFNAAIMLANQYNIHIHDENITGSILRTNNDENGHASLNLLCQYITARRSNIVGIVGPASSTNARFIGPFAAHINLPVISYAATIVDFSDIQLYPTFYRTVSSDLLLARTIVQQFEQFKWKTCTMIFAKNDYGYGGVRILSEGYHDNITIKAQLSFDGEKFHADLKQTLDKSQSRIVLVWADQEETTNIIKQAFKEGLIGQQYVWMTTNKVIIP
jgi:ABC-type branched-subunit amino acid transport system substrate-binding protein